MKYYWTLERETRKFVPEWLWDIVYKYDLITRFPILRSILTKKVN